MIPPINSEQAKNYTFKEYLQDSLSHIDPKVEIVEVELGRLQVRLNGDWHLMTIYPPPEQLLGAWLDVYPRQLQTDMMRHAIFAINSWCRLVTDPHTGLAVTP